MARMFIRELLRFRHTFLSTPTLLLSSPKPNQFSSPFSSTETKILTFPHLTLSFLKSCQNIKQLFQIHAHLIISGLFHQPFWAVNVLKHSSELGNIGYTVSVFRCIDKPGTFGVNTMIKAYSFSSFPHQALVFYFQMLANGCFDPNSFTFVALLCSCTNTGCFKSARMCHGQAVKFGVINQLSVQNSLIHVYGWCGVIEFAEKVLAEMSKRNLVSWNSLIDGCVKVWDLDRAHKLFDEMPKKNVVSWNIMINGYLKGGNLSCALKLFREMVKTGLVGDEKTVVSLLSACCTSARLKEGRSVHGFLIKNGLKSNIILTFPPLTLSFLNSCQDIKQLFQIHAHLIISGLFRKPFWAFNVLKHSSEFGNIGFTVAVFRCIAKPDTFGVNTMIKAYSFSSFPHQAIVFYFQMLANGCFDPNSFTFVALLGSCSNTGCFKSARMCHGQALQFGVINQLPVQNSLIHVYGCCGVIEFAEKLLVEMSKRDLVSWNSLIDGCVKVWDLRRAHKLFDAMPKKNVVSWNIMINGYLKGGNPGCALKLIREMVKTGLVWNEKTVVSVLSACSRSARSKEGRSVHGFLIKYGLKSNIIIDTALVDMYCNCRKVGVARMIFDKIQKRNLVCWNAMIFGHSVHGNPEDGLKLFMNMVDESKVGGGGGTSPDGITFLAVLCACSQAGLLAEGRNYFSQMIAKFGIKPNFAHLWCMANLYVRANLVQEAEEVLGQMPEFDGDVSSESLLWANLLSSCRFGEGVTVGEKISLSLLAKDPKNYSYYQLLLNVYAVAGQWEDVFRVKRIMKERKINRLPGCNLVDLTEIVHNLEAGDHWREILEFRDAKVL